VRVQLLREGEKKGHRKKKNNFIKEIKKESSHGEGGRKKSMHSFGREEHFLTGRGEGGGISRSMEEKREVRKGQGH